MKIFRTFSFTLYSDHFSYLDIFVGRIVTLEMLMQIKTHYGATSIIKDACGELTVSHENSGHWYYSTIKWPNKLITPYRKHVLTLKQI